VIIKIANADDVSGAQKTLEALGGSSAATGAMIAQKTLLGARTLLGGILGFEPMAQGPSVNIGRLGSLGSPGRGGNQGSFGGYDVFGNFPPSSGDYAGSYWTVKVAVSGAKGSGEGDGYAYDLMSRSALLALYHSFNGLSIGAALAAGSTETDFEDGARLDSDDFFGMIFGRADFESAFLSIEAFFGKSAVNSLRHPDAGLISEGDYRTILYGGALSAGKQFNLGSFRITPRLGLSYTGLNFKGMTERGAGNLSLTLAPAGARSLEIESGLFITGDFELKGSRLTPKINIGVAFETMDTALSVDTSFVGESGIPSFVSESRGAGRVRLIAEMGLEYGLSENSSLSIDYRGSFRRKDRIHSGTLAFKVNF
jgi:hypothetical protein